MAKQNGDDVQMRVVNGEGDTWVGELHRDGQTVARYAFEGPGSSQSLGRRLDAEGTYEADYPHRDQLRLGVPVGATAAKLAARGVQLEGETIRRGFNGVPSDVEEGQQWTDPSDGIARRLVREPGTGGGEYVEALSRRGMWERDGAFGEIAGRAADAWSTRCDELERIEINAASEAHGTDETYGQFVRKGATDAEHDEFERRQEERRAGARPLEQLDPAAVAAELKAAEDERRAWAIIERREALEAEKAAIEASPEGAAFDRGDGRRPQRTFSDRQIIALHRIGEALAALPPNPPRPAGKPPHRVTEEDLTDDDLSGVYGDTMKVPEAAPAEATA